MVVTTVWAPKVVAPTGHGCYRDPSMGKKRTGHTRERVEGSALFRTFHERNGIAYRTSATALGVQHPATWQWAHSVTIPLEKYRDNIEIWTSGDVPAASWKRKSEKDIKVRPFQPTGSEG